MEPVNEAVRRTVEDVCPTCDLRSVCAMAPAFLRLNAAEEDREEHPEAGPLGSIADRLRAEEPACAAGLVQAMADEDPARAHAAGCLLSAVWWDAPEKVEPFAEKVAERAGEDGRPLTAYEGGLLRLAALLQPEGLSDLLSRPHPLGRPGEPREVDAYGAIRAIASLLSGEMSQLEWAEALDEADPTAFRTSFVLRDPDDTDALDLFFEVRLAEKAAVFYLRRDPAGEERLVSLDAVRVSSILARLFKVFDSDERKCHRLFAKICRYLNKHVDSFSPARLLEGFRQLTKDELFVLGIYAPNLAKLMERQLEWDGLYRLIKYLHNLKGKRPEQPGEISGAHRKIYGRRDRIESLLDDIGRETFKDIGRTVFRIAAAYDDVSWMSSNMFRVGEVAYFMTALAGLNPKGLEISIDGENPLAFIAYGMQPPSDPDLSAHRYDRLRDVLDRYPPGSPEARAVQTGLEYMARLHGHDDLEAFVDWLDEQETGVPAGLEAAEDDGVLGGAGRGGEVS